MRKIICTLSFILISYTSIVCYGFVDSKWKKHFDISYKDGITTIPKFLIGEEIYFQVNSNNDIELKQFLSIKPDTIWIKRKKNPKLNKHYKLTKFYHGAEKQDYITEYFDQYTPSTEITNTIFRVDSVSDSKWERSSYSSTYCCYVYLYNLKTSENLIWKYQNDHNADLTVYSKTLGDKIIKDNTTIYHKCRYSNSSTGSDNYEKKNH